MGWSDQGVHMSNKNNPIIQECHFFTGRFFCHTGQYSVVQWQEMEKNLCLIMLSISSMLHFWKGYSMSIIPHILCRNIGFSKRGTALLKGG